MMGSKLFDSLAPRPWWPHVYIMRCAVNRPLWSKIAETRQLFEGEPPWMGDLRAVHSSDERAEKLLAPFVKIGSTYSEDPGIRTEKLSGQNAPTPTMMCSGVPVVGVSVLCYVPGEEGLERALHSRWRHDRIDPDREFFTVNAEMEALIVAWRPYSTRFIEPDPFRRTRSKW